MKTLHYAVFYSKDGSVHLFPAETREEAVQDLMNCLSHKRWHDRCARTTIIKRQVEDEFIFGKPESLNVLSTFDKKLKKGEIEYKGE